MKDLKSEDEAEDYAGSPSPSYTSLFNTTELVSRLDCSRSSEVWILITSYLSSTCIIFAIYMLEKKKREQKHMQDLLCYSKEYRDASQISSSSTHIDIQAFQIDVCFSWSCIWLRKIQRLFRFPPRQRRFFSSPLLFSLFILPSPLPLSFMHPDENHWKLCSSLVTG